MANPAVIEHQEQESGMQHASSGPQRLKEFIEETRQEMHKVHTPSRAEVQSTTIVVLVTVFIFAAYFELVDLVLGKGIDSLLLRLTKH